MNGEEFHQDVDRFSRVCEVVKAMRSARIAQIGARVMPFRTVRYSEKLLQQSGITVETEDLSEIFADIEAIRDEKAIADKVAQICAYGRVLVYEHDEPAGPARRMRDGCDGRSIDACAAQGYRDSAYLPGLEQQLSQRT